MNIAKEWFVWAVLCFMTYVCLVEEKGKQVKNSTVSWTVKVFLKHVCV